MIRSPHFFRSLIGSPSTFRFCHRDVSEIQFASSNPSSSSSQNMDDADEEIRDKILDASLNHVPQLGWSQEAVQAGIQELGYPSTMSGIIQSPGIELIHHHVDQSNNKIEKIMRLNVKNNLNTDTQAFLKRSMETRLRMNIPYASRWPEALAIMTVESPCKSFEYSLNLMDIFCNVMGDKSVDFNWYSKRLSLGLLYKSTELAMINDTSSDYFDTWMFLERRLQDIEKIETVTSGIYSIPDAVLGMNLQHSDIPFSKNCDEKEDKLLLEPFTYLLQAKGKNIRKKMLSAFNKWLNIPTEKLNKIGEIIQMLHNASLLLDDIEDNGILRRGIPTSHKIYGEPRTINCANYAMFIALERVIELNHPLASKIFSEQLLELHRGQGMEIYWRDSYQCPTEEEYRKMTIRKTGGLFALGVRLMQLFSESDSNYLELVHLLGLYFQIRDDYASLVMSEYHISKGFAEDLTEGKFSFPLVHAIKTNEEDHQIINILRKRTTEDCIKKHCIHLLEQCGSFEYTRNVLKDLDSKARAEVNRLGGNPLLDALLDELKNWENK